MRKTAFVLAGLVSAFSIALVGCDVHKTQEGKIDLPKYEVSKTKDGDVQLPKYEVTPPKVDVTTEQKEVKVPELSVHTEEKTVSVPQFHVTPGKDRTDDQAATSDDKDSDKLASRK